MTRLQLLVRPAVFIIGLISAAAAASAAAPPADENGPWPAPVKNFVAPAPGEHPRLLFRKADLPEIRRRAQTPEGQAIVKRLRVLLNGGDGESMPTVKNGSGKAYGGNAAAKDDAKDPKGGGDEKEPAGGKGELPVGAYTMSHAAGYGMLYQLTGDKKYADLGRQCFELAFGGVRDRDDRYSWKVPGGALRAGPSIGAYALGYDLCYDGWDPDFRRKVAEAFMAYDEGPNMSLESCALGKRQHPGSNHWGAEVGGPALVLLAIKGDPGADDKKVDALLDGSAKCMVRNLTEGFGDHGWFPEGDGPGAISSDTAFVPALQAWRVAGGRDFVTPRPNAPWMTLKWLMGTVPTPVAVGQKPPFPTRGGYPHNVWARQGMSGSGTFAQGFGAVADEHKPALLWLYNHTFKAGDEKAGAPFDLVSPYPHRAVLSLVNWPLGMEEKDPGAVMPRAVQDKKYAYYMFRNRWQDKNDVVVTMLLKTSKGNGSVPAGEVIVIGMGKQASFPVKVSGAPTSFEATATGGVVSTSAGSFGADFSGASGADALLVLAGPIKGQAKGLNVQQVAAGKNTFVVMTLQKGEPPKATADGDNLVVGGQTVSYDGQKVTFARSAPAATRGQ